MAGLEKLKGIVLLGGNAALADVAARDQMQWKLLDEKSVLLENVGADLADQNRSVIYPAVYLYSARMENVLRRKFNGFAGPIRFVADVRCTRERYDGLERELAAYVEAVTMALGNNAGAWGQNLTYSGAYAVKFEPVKLGGKNFIQSAKIEIEVEACG